MPRTWSDSVEEHRSAVRDTALDAAAALVAERGLTSVTMSGIAERSGIGRATLYKHYRDVTAVLTAWHERQTGEHLTRLIEVGGGDGTAAQRLEAVLLAWGLIAHASRGHGATELGELLHHDEHASRATRHLQGFVAGLISQGGTEGDLRSDIDSNELAAYCLHALTAARSLPGEEPVRRLVAVTMAGLRPVG